MNPAYGLAAPDSLSIRGRYAQNSPLAAPPTHFTIAFAIVVALLLSVRTPFSANISFGVVVALAAFPVTLKPWLSSRLALGMTALAGLALLAGLLLVPSSLSADPGRSFQPDIAIYQASVLVGLVATAAAAHWALSVLGLNAFLILWAAGLAIAVVIGGGGFDENPWKYGLALPVSVIALSVVSRGGALVNVTVLLTLVLISTASAYRSWIQVLVAAAIVIYVLRQTRETEVKARRSRVLVASALGGGVLGFGWLLTTMATSGVLGAAVQRRTIEQAEVSGNLLLGGRPEWGAAWALANESPAGIGLGVTPSSHDWSTAVRAMPFSHSGLQDVSTVSNAFRAGEVSFHSVLWTFWGNYGIVGMAFIFVLLVLIARALLSLDALQLNMPHMAAISVLLIGTVWDLLFSPLNLVSVSAVLGILAWLPQEIRRTHPPLGLRTKVSYA